MKMTKTKAKLELLAKKSPEETWLGGFLLLFSLFCFIGIPSVLAQEWSYRFGFVSYQYRVIIAVGYGLIGLFTLTGGCYNLFKKTVYIFDAGEKALRFGEFIFSKGRLAKVEFSELNGIEITSKELSTDKTRYWLTLKLKPDKKILFEEYFGEKKEPEDLSKAILEITGFKTNL